MVDKIISPPTAQAQINKINEIIDNLGQGSGGLSYTATCPAITISSGIASWSVNHNLGTTSVIAMLYNSFGAKQKCNVVVNSTNTITVSFKASANVTAGSYTIVVLGSGGNPVQFLRSNITTTGSLVDNQGILSSFSASNYASLPYNFSPSSYSWEMVLKINTPNVSVAYDPCYCTPTDRGIGIFIHNGKLIFSLGQGSSWFVTDVTGTTSLNANTDYYVKLEFTGSQYNSYLSTDGVNYNLEASYLSSLTIPSFPLCIGENRQLSGGFSGSIDLNESYIKINDAPFWDGVILVFSGSDRYDTTNFADKNLGNVTNTGKIAIAHNAMPQGERSYQFTFGANGAAYTAPADGYVQMYAEATGSGAFIGIYSTSISVMTVPFTSSSDCRGFFPIKKGQVFTCWFANVKNQNLTFYYAIGSESEYVGS